MFLNNISITLTSAKCLPVIILVNYVLYGYIIIITAPPITLFVAYLLYNSIWPSVCLSDRPSFRNCMV